MSAVLPLQRWLVWPGIELSSHLPRRRLRVVPVNYTIGKIAVQQIGPRGGVRGSLYLDRLEPAVRHGLVTDQARAELPAERNTTLRRVERFDVVTVERRGPRWGLRQSLELHRLDFPVVCHLAEQARVELARSWPAGAR